MTETFGEEIRRRRTALGLRQIDIAERAGVSLDTIQNAETGNRPIRRAKNIERVRTALELAENPPPPVLDPHENCAAGFERLRSEIDELATELAQERIEHQQTLAILRAIQALLDANGGIR